MIVVINPSSQSGHSFKGLHRYCAHDQDQQNTDHRVDWMATHNIATDDPDQAYKIMIATAQAQNELKRAAGVRAGRKSTQGPVTHVVLSFDEDEPQDEPAMKEAAHEFLSQLGVDPAKMRGKSKPKRRQFADEHQVIMYAHNDTGHGHLHLMINRVHPETGVNLPSNNDQLKAQKWALDYSKRHGTAHKTPAREENMHDRDNGEYVKANRRKSRNAFELEQEIKSASNDNDRVKAELEKQRHKDAALALRGRNLKMMQKAAWQRLSKGHKDRIASIGRNLQKQINQSKAQIRESFRPKWRALTNRQSAEQKTFDALEKTLFGKAGNMAKTVQLSNALLRESRGAIITRTFRILTNAAARKEYFAKAQNQQRRALANEQNTARKKEIAALKSAHVFKLEDNRQVYFREKKALEADQAIESDKIKQARRKRAQERIKALDAATQSQQPQKRPLPSDSGKSYEHLRDKIRGREDFDKARRNSAREQNNSRDRDDGQER